MIVLAFSSLLILSSVFLGFISFRRGLKF
jgi:hypothetical protein